MAIIGPVAFTVVTFFAALVLGFGLYHVFTNDVKGGLEAFLAVLFPVVFAGFNTWVTFSSASYVIEYQKEHDYEFSAATAQTVSISCKVIVIIFLVAAVAVAAIAAYLTRRKAKLQYQK